MNVCLDRVCVLCGMYDDYVYTCVCVCVVRQYLGYASMCGGVSMCGYVSMCGGVSMCGYVSICGGVSMCGYVSICGGVSMCGYVSMCGLCVNVWCGCVVWVCSCVNVC